MTHVPSKFVPADQIRRLYFGHKLNTKQTNTSTVSLLEPKEARDLTSSARFIAAEARSTLSERSTLESTPQNLDENTLLELVESIEEQHGEKLGNREQKAVVTALQNIRLDYDVLTPLIENTEVNDIIVRNWKDISAQVAGRKNIQTDLRFADEMSYKSFIENLLKRVGKACTVRQPVVDAAIEPDIRACVTHESFSPPGSGPMVTIRVARHNNVTIEKLARYELAPREILDYLAAVISHSGSTALIAGEVGTGKTTLARALASVIPKDEAILIIEDTNEIILNRPFVRTLLTREANTEGIGRITPSQAIRTGMRMAMNRVILGEMRDGEAAEAFIDVCSSGHAGLSTIHARSARDALSRLELLLSRVRGNMGTGNLKREIANAVALVVFLDVDTLGKRRIVEVLEVASAADGPLQFQPMFSFDDDDSEIPQWKRGSGISRWDQLLKRLDIQLPKINSTFGCSMETLYENYQQR